MKSPARHRRLHQHKRTSFHIIALLLIVATVILVLSPLVSASASEDSEPCEPEEPCEILWGQPVDGLRIGIAPNGGYATHRSRVGFRELGLFLQNVSIGTLVVPFEDRPGQGDFASTLRMDEVEALDCSQHRSFPLRLPAVLPPHGIDLEPGEVYGIALSRNDFSILRPYPRHTRGHERPFQRAGLYEASVSLEIPCSDSADDTGTNGTTVWRGTVTTAPAHVTSIGGRRGRSKTSTSWLGRADPVHVEDRRTLLKRWNDQAELMHVVGAVAKPPGTAMEITGCVVHGGEQACFEGKAWIRSVDNSNAPRVDLEGVVSVDGSPGWNAVLRLSGKKLLLLNKDKHTARLFGESEFESDNAGETALLRISLMCRMYMSPYLVGMMGLDIQSDLRKGIECKRVSYISGDFHFDVWYQNPPPRVLGVRTRMTYADGKETIEFSMEATTNGLSAEAPTRAYESGIPEGYELIGEAPD